MVVIYFCRRRAHSDPETFLAGRRISIVEREKISGARAVHPSRVFVVFLPARWVPNLYVLELFLSYQNICK